MTCENIYIPYYFSSLMPNVPKYSQLRPGVGVNIIIKKDQPTGRLTSGSISEILTNGDHPRGIKVRLIDGQVGRVQSLSSEPRSINEEFSASPWHETNDQTTSRYAKFSFQEDYRQTSTPTSSINIADYIKISPKKAKKSKVKTNIPVSDGGMTEELDMMNAQLQSEFPQLDSALVATILDDCHGHLTEARNILKALS